MYLLIEDLGWGFIGPFENEEAALKHAEKYYPEHYAARPAGDGYRCELVPASDLKAHERYYDAVDVETPEKNAEFWDNFNWEGVRDA